MPFILALDQGTTSSRAILFDHEGAVHAVAQQEFTQIFPKPGWVEHDPDEIWSSQRAVIDIVLKGSGVGGRDIAAVGITNQRETTVVWERATGRPIHNAIVWQDRRTAAARDRLERDGHEPLIREHTGLVADAYFSASKIAWLLDNVPGARTKAEAGALAFGTIDTWILWNLTGGALHVTEPSNASRTMLYDIRRGAWDDEMLDLFKIPRSMLPEVRSSSEVYGRTSSEACGLDVPIAGIAGDQQAALFGQMCHERGLAKNTYGTGCFLLLNTGPKPSFSGNRLLTTIAWSREGKVEYALEGSVFIGGAVVQWLRDGPGIIESSAESETLARSVDDNGGVYFVPAFAGLGAPHWDQYARGTIVGITRGVTAGHIARAALEGIAHQVADVLDAMKADSGVEIAELRVDGGASRNDLLMQFQADILGLPLVRPEVTETTALGAALLAGLAVGYWRDEKEIAGLWSIDRKFEPAMPADEVAAHREQWRKALERAKGWAAPG